MSSTVFIEFYRKHTVWLIVGAVLLLANIAALFLLSLPKINAEALNRQRLEQVGQQEADLRRVLEERRDLKQFIEKNREALDTFYSDILGTKASRLTAILKERQDIGNQFGVLPTRVRYSSDQVRDLPIEQFRMAFPLAGTYESLRFFIDTVEHSSNFFIIEDIELDSASQQGDELQMRITVSTFFHGESRVRTREVDMAEDEL